MNMRMKSTLTAAVALFGIVVASHDSQAAALYSDRAAWVASVPAYSDVDISSIPEYTTLPPGTAIGLPSGKTLSFDHTLEARQVPSSWATWSGGETPRVLFTLGIDAIKGTFSHKEKAFGMELEPNIFQTFVMTLKLDDGTSLSQTVDGYAGAKFFGWTDLGVVSFTATCKTGCDGFAIGRMVEGRVPEPATLSLIGLGLAGVAFARRRQTAKAAA